MIFQQFNLFASRNVFDNVAYPLKYSGMKKEDIRKGGFFVRASRPFR